MKAFVIDHFAHPVDVKVSENAPEPKLGPEDVLVDVYSAALNFFDILQATGKYQQQPPMPFVLGAELAGLISPHSPIPKGCPFKPGSPVFGSARGSYAERVAAPWKQLHLIPKGFSFDEAAGLFVTWPTSYEALVGRAKVQKGEWVLVHAGAGGVGLAAVQLAKVLGANVIATASTPQKRDICLKHGADHAIDYRKTGWQKEVMSITKGKGANVVYDPVGLIRDSLKCIAWDGRAVVVGFVGGEIEKLPTNLILLKNISVTGVFWGAYAKFQRERVPVVWDALLELFNSGKVRPVVYSKVFRGIENVGLALKALEGRETYGKVIIRVRESESERTQSKL